ncbi:MAG: DNA replication/repair protein RecF [Chloroflexi bacterium]|nr:DNA replication/repair protein RecF [Chloroflexota bacterium]
MWRRDSKSTEAEDVYLRSLQLTNYRNFRRLALSLDDGPTVIQAENAQGKTNLLEAIELLATTKSARASSDRELIHWGAIRANGDGLALAEPFARVSAVVAQRDGETRAEAIIRLIESTEDAATPGASKTFRINGLPRRAVEFVGETNVVSFSPDDVALVAGAPSGRRRYLDVTNAQMSSRYLRTLQRYTKVLLQRNQLLRQVRDRGRPDPSLSVWDQELATDGAYLLHERARSVQALTVCAARWFQELGGWGQKLQLRYRPGLPPPDAEVLEGIPTEADERLGKIRGAFLRALAQTAPREQTVGTSLVGPHRDDLLFVVDDVDLNVYGSRGQQRLAALSLKLAEVDVLARRVGSRPILLLDDVLSELDERKQAAVLRVAGGGGQTILTVTALDLIDRRGRFDASRYRLEAGALNAISDTARTPEPSRRLA